MTRPTPDGDCFQAAVRVLLDEAVGDDEDRYRLVHGWPIGQGPIEGLRHAHAWVERTDDPPTLPDDLDEEYHAQFQLIVETNDWTTVIDRSNGKNLEMPRTVFYGLGRIDRDDVVRYTKQEAMVAMLRHEHYGPWESADAAC